MAHRDPVDYFVLVLFVFVVLGLVFLVLRQEIGYDERLRNDLFSVKWDLKPYSVISIKQLR